MKKMITVFLALAFALFSLAYTGMKYAEIETKRVVEIMVLNEFEKNMSMVMDKVNEYIPFEYEAELDRMLSHIEEDEHIESLVEEYAVVVLDDLLLGEASGRLNLNEEAQKMSDLYLDEMAQVTADLVRPEIQKELMKDLLSQIDLNAQYDRAIQKIAPQIPDSQKDVLKQSRWLLNNYSTIQKGLLIVMLVLFLFAILLNRSSVGFLNVLQWHTFFVAFLHYAFYWSLLIWGNRFLRPYQITLEPKVFLEMAQYTFVLFLFSFLASYFFTSKKKDLKKSFNSEEDMKSSFFCERSDSFHIKKPF